MGKTPEKPAAPAKSAKQKQNDEKAAFLAEREADRAEAREFGKTLKGLNERVEKLEHFVKKVA